MCIRDRSRSPENLRWDYQKARNRKLPSAYRNFSAHPSTCRFLRLQLPNAGIQDRKTNEPYRSGATSIGRVFPTNRARRVYIQDICADPKVHRDDSSNNAPNRYPIPLSRPPIAVFSIYRADNDRIGPLFPKSSFLFIKNVICQCSFIPSQNPPKRRLSFHRQDLHLSLIHI